MLTHWPLGTSGYTSKMQFSILFCSLVPSDIRIMMPSNECHGTLLMMSQHWFRQWLGAVILYYTIPYNIISCFIISYYIYHVYYITLYYIPPVGLRSSG